MRSPSSSGSPLLAARNQSVDRRFMNPACRQLLLQFIDNGVQDQIDAANAAGNGLIQRTHNILRLRSGLLFVKRLAALDREIRQDKNQQIGADQPGDQKKSSPLGLASCFENRSCLLPQQCVQKVDKRRIRYFVRTGHITPRIFVAIGELFHVRAIMHMAAPGSKAICRYRTGRNSARRTFDFWAKFPVDRGNNRFSGRRAPAVA